MKIAITGGSGFIGRYILRTLSNEGHELFAWRRTNSDLSGLESIGRNQLHWIGGSLTDPESMKELVSGCDAVVHGAIWKPGPSFRDDIGDLAAYVQCNVVGTLQLIQTAIAADVEKFVFLSTCAVHEKILSDRALDESHPLWALSHYGAHKAAIEKFVHSYGMGQGYNICALRPTGVYGVNHPVSASKWFDLVSKVAAGNDVSVSGGGKEVHASDVARAVSVLLSSEADKIAGEAFNCYDQYISQYEVATIAKESSNSNSRITGAAKQPKHQIETGKLRSLGMKFGGSELLRSTIEKMVSGL